MTELVGQLETPDFQVTEDMKVLNSDQGINQNIYTLKVEEKTIIAYGSSGIPPQCVITRKRDSIIISIDERLYCFNLSLSEVWSKNLVLIISDIIVTDTRIAVITDASVTVMNYSGEIFKNIQLNIITNWLMSSDKRFLIMRVEGRNESVKVTLD